MSATAEPTAEEMSNILRHGRKRRRSGSEVTRSTSRNGTGLSTSARVIAPIVDLSTSPEPEERDALVAELLAQPVHRSPDYVSESLQQAMEAVQGMMQNHVGEQELVQLMPHLDALQEGLTHHLGHRAEQDCLPDPERPHMQQHNSDDRIEEQLQRLRRARQEYVEAVRRRDQHLAMEQEYAQQREQMEKEGMELVEKALDAHCSESDDKTSAHGFCSICREAEVVDPKACSKCRKFIGCKYCTYKSYLYELMVASERSPRCPCCRAKWTRLDDIISMSQVNAPLPASRLSDP